MDTLDGQVDGPGAGTLFHYTLTIIGRFEVSEGYVFAVRGDDHEPVATPLDVVEMQIVHIVDRGTFGGPISLNLDGPAFAQGLDITDMDVVDLASISGHQLDHLLAAGIRDDVVDPDIMAVRHQIVAGPSEFGLVGGGDVDGVIVGDAGEVANHGVVQSTPRGDAVLIGGLTVLGKFNVLDEPVATRLRCNRPGGSRSDFDVRNLKAVDSAEVDTDSRGKTPWGFYSSTRYGLQANVDYTLCHLATRGPPV